MVQKLMWDFPQVTIRLSSMGWNTAASTESLEHCRDGKREEKRPVSLRIVATAQIWTMDLLGTLTSASCFSFCQFQTDRMWSLASSTAHKNVPPFWQDENQFNTIIYLYDYFILQVHISKSPDGCSSYRLGESHACDRSVKHSHPDNVKCVEGHGVPNANMRREGLNIQKWHTGFKQHMLVSKNLQLVAWLGLIITFPSLEFPATWPVAMVTISGCTHKLRAEN